MPSSWILTEDYAGLRNQALGLAEAAGLAPDIRMLRPRGVWRHLPARLWPNAAAAIAPEALAPPLPEVLVGCGGKSAAVLAALRKKTRTVIVQNPRLPISRFDLVVAARHDELTGANVLVTRTALHRATPQRLAAEAEKWRPTFAHLPRPLVAVLVGGSNGRFTLDMGVGRQLAAGLAETMARDGAGVALTPSRRTDPEVARHLSETLQPLGAYIYDFTGENPYFGLLALADVIVATGDSVSMISEAAATRAPVLLVALPGKSRRIGLFTQALIDDGRIRPYQGRLEHWPVEPVDDTEAAAAEMRRRLGF